MPDATKLAREICEATRGINWDAQRAGLAVKALLACRGAPAVELAQALDVLLDRLQSSQPEDGDGVAHVAMTAGTLVEYGQPPERLGEVLFAKLPAVLSGARRCADRCLAEVPSFESEEEEEEYFEPLWAEALAQVDQKPISRAMIRAALQHDRPAATALAYLEQWTLPTVAAVSRSASLRAGVSEHSELLECTSKLRHSTAGWLYDLFRTERDSQWLVLCPKEERGFMIRVDGVSSNFNLHEVVSDVLIRHGIPAASTRLERYCRPRCWTSGSPKSSLKVPARSSSSRTISAGWRRHARSSRRFRAPSTCWRWSASTVRSSRCRP